jgi:hypothetical protein
MITKVQIDQDGDYFIELEDELMDELGWEIGTKVNFRTEMIWNEATMDYDTRVIIEKG